MKLGRVRWADLEEGDALGEGTFGTVLSGTYRGRDVAIKKARGALGSTSIMEAFRLGCLFVFCRFCAAVPPAVRVCCVDLAGPGSPGG